MDGAMIGWIGGTLGALGGIAGAYVGCRATYRQAETEAQRAFLRRLYRILVVISAVFVALVFGTATAVLPRWVHWALMVAVFAPLPFFIMWFNRRFAELGRRPGG